MSRPIFATELLKVLSPASQRFYEVLSYRIFATLKNKLSTADISYSEYCMLSAQERYFTWGEVKNQMYRIHKAHSKSGYIEGVSHEATSDSEDRPDWILRYVPGPKAKAEYKTFNSKGKRDQAIDVEFESAAPEPLQEPTLPPLTDDEQKHIQELTGSFGVSLEKSEALVRAYPLVVKLQLEVFPYRNKKPKDRAGWIIKAIEQSYAIPPDYEERRRREEAKVQAEKETRLKNARSRHEDDHRAAYLSYLEEREGEVQRTHHEASRGLGQRSILEREKLSLTSHGKIKELQLRIFDKRESRLNRFYEYFKQHPECEVLDFWTWDSTINRTPFQG